MDATLLSDLIAYRKDRDRGVVAASRALLQLYRQRMPELLHKKERGRGADLTAKPEAYGSSRVSEGVSGVELLASYEEKRRARGEERDEAAEWEVGDGSGSDDGASDLGDLDGDGEGEGESGDEGEEGLIDGSGDESEEGEGESEDEIEFDGVVGVADDVVGFSVTPTFCITVSSTASLRVCATMVRQPTQKCNASIPPVSWMATQLAGWPAGQRRAWPDRPRPKGVRINGLHQPAPLDGCLHHIRAGHRANKEVRPHSTLKGFQAARRHVQRPGVIQGRRFGS